MRLCGILIEHYVWVYQPNYFKPVFYQSGHVTLTISSGHIGRTRTRAARKVEMVGLEPTKFLYRF